MERTKRMLIVMLTSFGIFALLTFLTFSSYGQTTSTDYTVQIQNTNLSSEKITDDSVLTLYKVEDE
ncbi:hypothetical protein ACE193_08645 [Bernardetia sp. OM2101]|uniref:hypothetical protein n=1 Tax=Bernardetia sp. OM2101 TaxID=3344876 RepID=UPI0035CFAEE2